MRYPPVQIILFVLFVVTALLWIGVFQVSKNCCVLSVHFFDVGQGDAILIQAPGGRQILIDGGPPGRRILEKLSSKMPFFDRSIDIVIATHQDADHIGGLVEVLKRYKVDYVVWNGVPKENTLFNVWEREVVSEGAQVLTGHAGLRMRIGKAVVIETLHPLKERNVKKSNNTSIVLRMLHGINSFLLTGDIEKEVEKALSDSGVGLESKILKVAHHGSKTSSSVEFVEKVAPKFAIIQVGRQNSYGHPHQKVLQTFKSLGIPVLRTDRNGDIVVKSDGISLRIE